MTLKTIPPVYLIAAALVAGAMLYVKTMGAANVGRDLGKAAGDAVGGVVVGLGESVGIPATNADKCATDKAAGNTWDASFSCPAGDFVSWVLK